MPRQWRLTDRDRPPLDGWQRHCARGLTLDAHPDTMVWGIYGPSDTALGWVVDAHVALHADGSAQASGPIVFENQAPDDRALERAFFGRAPDAGGKAEGFGLYGRWTAIVAPADKPARIYLAPTQTTLYDGEQRIVATSPSLFPVRDRDAELSALVDPLDTRRYYAFGQTAFRNSVAEGAARRDGSGSVLRF